MSVHFVDAVRLLPCCDPSFLRTQGPSGTRGAVLEGGRRHIDPAGVYTVHFWTWRIVV